MQETSTSAPVIPALTPLGFVQWQAILALAYPDEEWERLSKVVLALPVEADSELIEGKPESLPKQISRHLFPDSEARIARKLFDNAISNFLEDFASLWRRIPGRHRSEFTRLTDWLARE
jgi:hypothetical protein